MGALLCAGGLTTDAVGIFIADIAAPPQTAAHAPPPAPAGFDEGWPARTTTTTVRY